MKWFKNLKTVLKLFLGFGVMIVLLGLVIVMAYGTITAIRDSQQRLFNEEFVGVVDLVELRADLNRQRARMFEMMDSTNRTEQETWVQDIRSRAHTSMRARVGVTSD